MNFICNVYFDMLKYFNNDIRRINHASKVYCFAKMIAEKEKVNKDTQTIIEIASILHDIGIKVCEQKYNSTLGHFQEIEGPIVAQNILKAYEIDNSILNRVLYLIGNHHSYNKIDDIDFQILVEADFLVNIYEDNMSLEQIRKIKEKYFKTVSGTDIIRSMYNL
ncbi:HD domain-containing protein [Caldicellulosiruptoraceae bacterium PP1]